MPYPNEHACRIRDPGEFEDGSFRRIVRDKFAIIIGKLKGKSTTTTQAFRYPKSDWSEDAARSHCKEQGGSFEAARETQEFSDNQYLSPEENPFIRIPEDD